MVFFRRRPLVEPSVPVGTVWTITEDGTWNVPATGSYKIEIHGGGGGGSAYNGYYGQGSAGGGGSGKNATQVLTYGDALEVTIGKGGAPGEGVDAGGDGGTTTFGPVSMAGGKGGTQSSAGAASGGIATAGEHVSAGGDADGGLGNKNKPNQKYGNGGAVDSWTPQSGQDGAVIVTYLGE